MQKVINTSMNKTDGSLFDGPQEERGETQNMNARSITRPVVVEWGLRCLPAAKGLVGNRLQCEPACHSTAHSCKCQDGTPSWGQER